jgi:hypothetical protein
MRIHNSALNLEDKKNEATYLNVELGENVESFRLTKQSQNSGRQKNI